MANLGGKQLDTILQHMLSQKIILQTDKENRIYIHQTTFKTLQQKSAEYLKKYHEINPLKAGMPKEELRSKFPRLSNSKLFNLVINQMIKNKQIVQEENTVRLDSHRVSLGEDQADVREKILKTYQEGGLQPLYFREVVKKLDADAKRTKEVLMLLVEDGQIVKTKDDLYFHAGAVDELKNRLVDFLK